MSTLNIPANTIFATFSRAHVYPNDKENTFIGKPKFVSNSFTSHNTKQFTLIISDFEKLITQTQTVFIHMIIVMNRPIDTTVKHKSESLKITFVSAVAYFNNLSDFGFSENQTKRTLHLFIDTKWQYVTKSFYDSNLEISSGLKNQNHHLLGYKEFLTLALNMMFKFNISIKDSYFQYSLLDKDLLKPWHKKRIITHSRVDLSFNNVRVAENLVDIRKPNNNKGPNIKKNEFKDSFEW